MDYKMDYTGPVMYTDSFVFNTNGKYFYIIILFSFCIIFDIKSQENAAVYNLLVSFCRGSTGVVHHPYTHIHDVFLRSCSKLGSFWVQCVISSDIR